MSRRKNPYKYNSESKMYGTDYEISVIDEWERSSGYSNSVPEPVVIDPAKTEKYAYDLIADEISMADVPADYQEAVKELRLKILRGE